MPVPSIATKNFRFLGMSAYYLTKFPAWLKECQ